MPSDGHREMNSPIANAPPPAVWQHLTPAVFVVLWSTGFIGAKFGLPYAETPNRVLPISGRNHVLR